MEIAQILDGPPPDVEQDVMGDDEDVDEHELERDEHEDENEHDLAEGDAEGGQESDRPVEGQCTSDRSESCRY